MSAGDPIDADGCKATILARLTPPGRGAIACLGLRGPRAWEIVRGLARRTLPETPASASVFVTPLGDANSSDECMVLFRRPEDVEIHCHGGPEVVRWIQAAAEGRGAVGVSADDWAARLGERGEMLDRLARCLTPRTAGIVLDQIAGAFDRAVGNPANHDRLRRLISVGEHMASPWRVVLAGAPNVGKSSLVNALAGFARSLVAETPGTTRDVVSTIVALDGWPIELLDTAGIRDAKETLETLGIARGHAAAASADLVLRVVDATVAPPTAVAASELLVVNKIDESPAWDVATHPEAVCVSAKTGEGIERLITAIVAQLVPEPPSPGEGVPVTREQIQRVQSNGPCQSLNDRA